MIWVWIFENYNIVSVRLLYHVFNIYTGTCTSTFTKYSPAALAILKRPTYPSTFYNLTLLYTLLEKFWQILLYLTDDAIAKLDVPKSFVK